MNDSSFQFVDISTKAKELGCSDVVVRTRMLSGETVTYIYFRGHVEGSETEVLPVWSEDKFPDVEWDDLGCPFDSSGTYDHGTRNIVRRKETQKPSFPRYFVNGWVQVPPGFVGEVMTKKAAVPLTGWDIGIQNVEGQFFSVQVLARTSLEDVAKGAANFQVEPADLLLKAEPIRKAGVTEDPRRVRSLLRIIRALDAMAKLPNRGAASAIEMQIEKLGFQGPNDETIRKILEEARALTPEKS